MKKVETLKPARTCTLESKSEPLRISLAAARINAGLSQRGAAVALRVTQTTITNWETGRTHVSEAMMDLMSMTYGIPRENLRRPEEPR